MAENNKTRFFYVLYSDKTRVFDQSERAYYPIYIIIYYIILYDIILYEVTPSTPNLFVTSPLFHFDVNSFNLSFPVANKMQDLLFRNSPVCLVRHR